LKIAKSDIRSHQITLEESKRNSLVQFEEIKESIKDSKAQFNKELKTLELLVVNMNRTWNKSLS